MKKLMLGLFALLLAVSQSVHADPVFTVQRYDATSVTFTLSGQMPADDSSLFGGNAFRLNLLYTGNLWAADPGALGTGVISASPFQEGYGVAGIISGGFSAELENYTAMEFNDELMGFHGTGSEVTLNLGGLFLNESGTGEIILYWGALVLGIDDGKVVNTPFGRANVVDGEIVPAASDVPEPAGIALFGLGLLALGALRRRQA